MRIPTLIFMIHIVPGYGNNEEILFYENIQSLEIRENWETYPLGNHQKGICNKVIKKTQIKSYLNTNVCFILLDDHFNVDNKAEE